MGLGKVNWGLREIHEASEKLGLSEVTWWLRQVTWGLKAGNWGLKEVIWKVS